MKYLNTSLVGGALILVASTNLAIIKNGGYFTSNAGLMIALGFGVFAASIAVMNAKKNPAMAKALVIALIAGELYNLGCTAERIIAMRDEMQTPTKAITASRADAVENLKKVESTQPDTLRLQLAKTSLASAADAFNTCKKGCVRKQQQLVAAQQEVKSAATEAQLLHETSVKEAQAKLDSISSPPSATPLADRTGIPQWFIDLAFAVLLSVGANGLAAVLIAHGASSIDDVKVEKKTEVIKEKGDPNGGQKIVSNGRGRKADPKIISFAEAFNKRNGRRPKAAEIHAQFPHISISTAYDYSKRVSQA